ncbi:Nramp family divalent metal transporter [Brevibacterium sp. VCM10]|uniref:Nramp family divalent metal transporter n=1 Tax=Brevibacterium sp. VCM10 TaxID=1381751 RepID=UPI000472F291|nr:Nramp family divalent metal transporter [Brevibacterium sp. VCM10]
MTEQTIRKGAVQPTATEPSAAARHPRRFWRTLALIGPAFVAGAWQFGPGNLASAVQAGSAYQYTLIWVIVVSTVLMIFLTDMSVRLGIQSPVSLISSIKKRLGSAAGMVAGIGVFLITLCFSVGNAVGAGLGLSLLVPGTAPVMWSLICTLFVASILFIRSTYAVVEKILVVMIAVMAICFVVSAFVSGADWAQAASSLVPSVPSGAWILVIALVGTNFSINAAFYASYATRERKRTAEEYKTVTLVDTIPGIVAPGIMTILVIVVAAAVLGQTGSPLDSFAGLAKVFEPLAGPVGGFIFALGFCGSALSSMIPNAIAGGTMLSDAFGRGASAGTVTARVTSGCVLAFGLMVTLLFQGSPVQLIILAQALTVLVAPILAILIVFMANDKGLMGPLRNKWWQNVFGIIGVVSVCALSIRLLINFFV